MVQYKTPGVYVEEINSLPPAVAPVNTAIPVFIGYTGAPASSALHRTATRIASWSEYLSKFGQCAPTKITVNINERRNGAKTIGIDVTNVDAGKVNPVFYLYYSVQLYFANGGGPCYILSVGNDVAALATAPTLALNSSVADFLAVTRVRDIKHFTGGLYTSFTSTGANPVTNAQGTVNLKSVFEILEEFDEPTLVVIPDALAFDDAKSYLIYGDALKHCEKMQDRFAILDVPRSAPLLWNYFASNGPGVHQNSELVRTIADVDSHFRNATAAPGSNELSYGAAYFPYVKSSFGFVTNDSNIIIGSYTINNSTVETAAMGTFPTKSLADNVGLSSQTKYMSKDFNSVYKAVKYFVDAMYLTLPPSGAIAGVYAATDHVRGVWKAPANVRLNGVIAPSIAITNDMNDSLNDDSTGKSVNAIRNFTGRGTLVWGARTLDAIDLNWRFVNVRRTALFIEESVAEALEAFVFEPNTSNTWSKVKAMTENFLTLIWRQGGLAGAKAEDAFEVNIGLNSTMSAVDIAAGIMTLEIVLVMPRPAEVIVIRVSQKLQES
jgi:uncharacterized protein